MRTPTPNGNARMTMTTRTKVASMSRYSAMPPLMTRFVRLRSRRPDIQGLPSIGELVDGGEEHGGEGRHGHGRARRERADDRELLSDAGERRQRQTERLAQIDVNEDVERRDRHHGLDAEAHPDEGHASHR